jgi:UDP-glucose 4-epimerase
MLGESIAGRRFIITGGCGFIGGHLVDKLLELPHSTVVVVDDCRYGRYVPLTTSNRYTLVRHRIGSESLGLLRSIVQRNDIVFHLAAEKLHQSEGDQAGMLESNIQGTWRVLEAATNAGASRVVIASSLYAHGRMSGPALREDDFPAPATVYGVSKLASEYLLQSIRRTTGLKGLVLRFFFVYGPRQFSDGGYRSVILRNFDRLAKGKAPTICGDGKQGLDFVYIDDVVRALVFSADSHLDGDVINIGSGHAITINQLVEKMQRTVGTDFNPQFIRKDFTHGSMREADVARASEKLGFHAEISIEEGLASTWAWLQREAA